MAQVDRLGILERGVLSSSSLCCGSFVTCGLHFFPFKVRTSKNSNSFHRVAKGEFNTNRTLLKEDFNTNKTLLERRELYPVKLSLAKVCGGMGTQG